MTEISQNKLYDPIETLARSLFGFAIVAWLPMLITWVLFLLSPVSPDGTFAQIRAGIIIGFGLLTLLELGMVVWLFRQQMATLEELSKRINRILGHRGLALFLVFVLLEINFLAFLALGNIAPTITNPAKFLLVCWTLLFFGLLLTIHWADIQAWLTRTQGMWVSIGLTTIVFVILSGLLIITTQIISATGIIGRLQGSFDYRQLEFIEDGRVPTSQQFWSEQGQMKVRWLPYNYWTTVPFDGEYINITGQGLRYTPSYIDDDSTQKLYFFGGSTMWGEGARDAYTIAGHTAQLLADTNQAQNVMNYGQTGYVSTQDMIMFQTQLALENVPDIAVFYQGFNDVFSAYLQDMAGIPLRESQRVSDVEAGRLLRGGQPVLRPPDTDISSYDWSLVSFGSASASDIANRWLANVKLIESVTDDYGVDVLFVWQPALFAKETLVGDERRILADLDITNPNFITLYREVDRIIRNHVENESIENIIILTDLFADNEQPIFYDLVHITEIGNLAVAEEILPILLDLLEA